MHIILRQEIKSLFFTCQHKNSFQSEQIVKVEKKTAEEELQYFTITIKTM
jgi:hypothetical protein